jgi:hypothetical protein
VLRWKDGLFLPVAGVSSFDHAAKAAKAEDVFLTLLRRFTRENRFVGSKPGPSYAPAAFANEDEAQKAAVQKTALAAAMLHLFQTGTIWNEPWGRPSRPNYRIAIKSE